VSLQLALELILQGETIIKIPSFDFVWCRTDNKDLTSDPILQILANKMFSNNSEISKADVNLLGNMMAFDEACLKLVIFTDSSLESVTLEINESVQDKLNSMNDADLISAIAIHQLSLNSFVTG
jgi:hypothetical protein